MPKKSLDRVNSVDSIIEQDSPALSDISERDAPWDEHRATSDKVSDYYQGTEFQGYSDKIRFCSEVLDFRLIPNSDTGEYKLKLSSARFCRVRTCQVCIWRRSLRWKARAYENLPKVVIAYPSARYLFVTLTVRNCAITELRQTLDWMNKSFVRMTKLKDFPAIGWIKSVEVTRGRTPSGSAHPHFHVLMMVKPAYFSYNYLSKDDWIQLWRRSLRVDYNPSIDVKAVKPRQSPVALIPEILKYQTKPSDLVADREWFLEMTRQMAGTKAISLGGVLREFFRDLEKEPEDLIGKDDDGEELIDEGHLYFGWRRKEKKYKLNS
jgi:plasmid rolling circle replication initiator protein Rep